MRPKDSFVAVVVVLTQKLEEQEEFISDLSRQLEERYTFQDQLSERVREMEERCDKLHAENRNLQEELRRVCNKTTSPEMSFYKNAYHEKCDEVCRLKYGKTAMEATAIYMSGKGADLLRAGDKIQVVKEVREASGWGLKESVDYVNAYPLVPESQTL